MRQSEAYPTKSSVRLLRYDVYIHGGGIAQESVNGGHVKIFSPAFDCGASEDYLGHVFFAHEFRGGGRNIFSGQLYHFCAETFRKLNVGLQRIFILLGSVDANVHVDGIEFSIHAASHARGACNQILRARIGAEADRNTFAYCP